MGPETQPTAEGDLGRTPFAHLLVYAMDRRLTGALTVTDPAGTEHVIRVVRGTPVKIRPGDAHALLGELLVETGALTPPRLEAALQAKGRLGDVLILSGSVAPEQVEAAASSQFVRRMVRMFSLPPETRYRYYDGDFALIDWGGEPAEVDPLALVWMGLRAHAATSSMMDATLGRLGDAPMRVHSAAVLSRFAFGETEQELLEAVQSQPVTLAELLQRELALAETVRRLVYTLLITRQLDLGGDTIPVGAGDAPPAAVVGVAKMSLRSTVHRIGAAAPDLPGDGERAAVSRRSRRRERVSGAGEEIDAAPRSSPRDGPDSGPVSSRPIIDAPAVSVDAEDNGAPVTRRLSDAPPDEPDVELPAAVAVAAEPLESSAVTPELEPPPLEPPPPAGVDASTPAPVLLARAEAGLRARDLVTAQQLWELARRTSPLEPDTVAVGAWLRSMMPGADLKGLTVELDELLHDDAPHVRARFVRGLLRQRLSDDAGAIRDLQRVVELAPDHPEAGRELAALEARHRKPQASLLSRLFRR